MLDYSTNWLDLKDRVCVVTGAASGIGAAIARELVVVGAKVALLDRNVEGLNTQLQAIQTAIPSAQLDAVPRPGYNI